MYFDGDPSPYAKALWSSTPQGFPNQKTNAREAAARAIAKLGVTATNKPSGPALASIQVKVPSSSEKVVKAATKAHANKSAAGQISLLLVGETHRHGPDEARADSLLTAIHQGQLGPRLIVLERGMDYNVLGLNPPPVKEKNLCGFGGVNFNDALSAKVRSVVVAGFLFWVLASGDQSTNDFVLVLFGENHKDIIEDFDYFCEAKSLTGIDWVDRRPRSYSVMRSQA